MTTTEIAQRDVEAYLEKVGGNYVAAYNEILADEQKKALSERPKSNAEIRKAAYAKAVHTLDRKQIASMNKTVRSFLPLAKANSAITATTGILTPAEAEDLMVEVLEVKRLSEIAKSRYEEIRKRVFNSITERAAQRGDEFPEYVQDSIEIPKLGLKFNRGGGNRKDPYLNEGKLESLVGADVWKKVTTVEVIPAQEVRTFDHELFLQAARKDPKLLEKLRAALTVGEFGHSVFTQSAFVPEQSDKE